MRMKLPPVDERFQVYAEKFIVESVSETETRFTRTSFGCNGKLHAKDITHETYEGQGEGDVIDVESEQTETLGPCDDTCSGNITGRRGWFTLDS